MYTTLPDQKNEFDNPQPMKSSNKDLIQKFCLCRFAHLLYMYCFLVYLFVFLICRSVVLAQGSQSAKNVCAKTQAAEIVPADSANFDCRIIM